MNLRVKALILLMAFVLFPLSASADDSNEIDASQRNYEQKNKTVVRNKLFYKKGKLELGITGGLMPYDSLVTHFMAGPRLQWHLSDHWGWEIIDLQFMFPSVKSFTTEFASRNGGPSGIQNLEILQNKWTAASSLLMSPFYGKLRLFGRSTIHFDFYVVLGLGLANVENHLVSSTNVSLQSTNLSPMINFGVGFKTYMNKSFAILLDFRDYIAYTNIYGGKRFQSNFTVQAGLSFFLG